MLLSIIFTVAVMSVIAGSTFGILYFNEKYEISESFDAWVHEQGLFIEVSSIPAILILAILGLVIHDEFGQLMLVVAGVIVIADVIYFIIKSVIKKGFNKEKSIQTFFLLLFVPFLMAAIKTGGIEGTMAVIAIIVFIIIAIVGIWRK